MFATAVRPRRSTLTNVVVHQSMRAWAGNCAAVSVQVFDILHVIQSSVRANGLEPSRLGRADLQKTFQNVCSYYDIRMVVRYKW